MESKYELTLHKKSYLLTGISRDDPNKEKVKELGAKWNSSLSGWLFFPDKHKDGLKFAKEIGAKIDEQINLTNQKIHKNKECKDKKCCEKYKLEIQNYKSEIENYKSKIKELQDKIDKMGDVLGKNGLGISDDDENDDDENDDNENDDESKDKKEYTISKSDLIEELKELYKSDYCVVYNKDHATHYVKYQYSIEENEEYITIENIINYDEYNLSLPKNKKCYAINIIALLGMMSDKPNRKILRKMAFDIISNLPKYDFSSYIEGDNITITKDE